MKFNSKQNWKRTTLFSLPILLGLAGCDSDVASDLEDGDAEITITTTDDGDIVIGGDGGIISDDDAAAGGVFAMSNILDANSIVAYSRAADGTLSLVGEFATGGQGGDFDGPEGLDPLISAYALINTPNNEYLMAVNAGSNTISVMQINDDMSLELVDTESSFGTGPNSLAFHEGIVYVTNIDADGEFAGEPDQEGSIYGYTFSGCLLYTSPSPRD